MDALPPEQACLTRWRTRAEHEGLTWGKVLDGDNFVRAAWEAATAAGITGELNVLEFGPGYGRLPRSMQRLGVPLARYTGVDISSHNVGKCGGIFADDPRFYFVLSAFCDFLGEGFDLLVSSLVLKHQYPNCECALRVGFDCLRPGGLVVFNVPEGDGSTWESPECFVKCYTRPEIAGILAAVGFEDVGFTDVSHGDRARLLVIGRRSPPAW